MCKLSRKQVLFNHLVNRLVEWQRRYDNDKISSVNQILQKFGFIRLMKLLYFVCLESVDSDAEAGEKSNKELVEETLFGLYDNFHPLFYGPVEMDVYNNRSILPALTFDGDYLTDGIQSIDKLKLFYSTLRDYDGKESVLSYLFQKEEKKYKLDYYKDLVDQSLKMLEQRTNFDFTDKDFLVNLSHSLKLWEYAHKYDIALPTNKFNLLKEEKDLFIQKLTKDV